jgi:ketosteroid isomerase-like protein
MNDAAQIRRLIAQYAQLADVRDAVGRSQLFTEDALYVPTTGRFVGRAAIRAAIEERSASQPADRQSLRLCANSAITIDGDRAEATTDFVQFTRVGEQPWQIDLVGRYYDKFARHGDFWLYTENLPRPLSPPLAPAV